MADDEKRLSTAVDCLLRVAVPFTSGDRPTLLRALATVLHALPNQQALAISREVRRLAGGTLVADAAPDRPVG